MEIVELQKAITRMASKFANDRGFLPPSIDIDDLVQEGLITAMQCEQKFVDDGRAKFSTYISSPIKGRWCSMIADSHFGPSSSVRAWRRKKGLPIDYGEISIECVCGEDSSAWFESEAQEDCEMEISFFSLTLTEAKDCLIDIRRQIKQNTGVGISFAKTRKKFHVEVTVCKRQQFVGQFQTMDEAKKAKIEFLESFMDAVLGSIEDESPNAPHEGPGGFSPGPLDAVVGGRGGNGESNG